MGLLSSLDKLEMKRPNAITIWSTTQAGMKYQANIQMKKNGGWSVQFGMTVEEALMNAIAHAMSGRVDTTETHVEAARNAIRAHASEEQEEVHRPKSAPRERMVKAPAKQERMRF